LLLSWNAVGSYFRDRGDLVPTLGLLAGSAALGTAGQMTRHQRRQPEGWKAAALFVHCVYLLALSLLAFTAMHVQV